MENLWEDEALPTNMQCESSSHFYSQIPGIGQVIWIDESGPAQNSISLCKYRGYQNEAEDMCNWVDLSLCILAFSLHFLPFPFLFVSKHLVVSQSDIYM